MARNFLKMWISIFIDYIAIHKQHKAKSKPQFNLFYIRAQNFGLNIKRSSSLGIKSFDLQIVKQARHVALQFGVLVYFSIAELFDCL